MGAVLLASTVFETAFGWVGLAGSASGLKRSTLPKRSKDDCLAEIHWIGDTVSDSASFGDLPDRIRRYFAGEEVSFSDVLDLSDGTPFHRAAWLATREIPYGQTQTYGWLAENIGRPGSARAIGRAMGANPVPIIVPCHRVVGSDGGLRGFGGGLDLKERMLRLEGAWI